jgi:DNA-directed RNA polymerase subunit RPC12/RpoP
MIGDVVEQTLYKCDRCGATNIVAAPVVYQQGTHTYSNRFNSGTSQTFSAQAAAPPKPRGYGKSLLFWGIPIGFTFFWGFTGLLGILDHSKAAATLGNTVAVLLLLGVLFISGMLLNFRRIALYNHEVYPRLHWNWEHTYICRRCGNSQLISS